ncbi:T9SS type A sorting domain-containing protein [Taibaiella sp. KBW10]|uniref:T9SS type A sorting domain-containing protein n=1 Tax=Taibaiella sp. KBW10 TaxID=2153357 RepID=UPI000F5933FA|nr:T9SS type A sorting domain-containing protein [Taibaiella sp. KBW10]
MKNYAILAIVFMSLLNIDVYGQGSSDLPRYQYSKQPNAAYNPLTTGAIQFDLPVDWDEEESDAVNMPFPFFYQNVLIGNIKANGNGSLILNGAINPDAELGNIIGLSMDYESKNRGKVLYETTGSSPSRIFKVEYRNIGLFDDTLNVDSLNYQIWLYEGSNAIEYRAGYSNVPDTQFAQNTQEFFSQQKKVLHIGLFQNRGNVLSENPDSIYFQCVKSNDVDSLIHFPEMIISGNDNAFVKGSYKKFPVEGSVFRFTPRGSTTSLEGQKTVLSKIYPNPSTTGKFLVLLKHTSKSDYNIYDLKGSCVRAGTVKDNRLALDLSSLAKGLYVLNITNDGNTESVKLVYE